MFRSMPVVTAADLEAFCQLPGLSALTSEAIARQRPDASWRLLDPVETMTARCSLWWRDVPAHPGQRLGLIGHYAATSAESAGAMLTVACEQLATHGCTMAVGPLDGTTWQRYRLLTERGTEPLFFLEPDNPDDWPGHWLAAGFTPLSTYFSAVNNRLDEIDPRMPEIIRRMAEQGITMRTLDTSRFEDELRRIHPLSLASFKDNFLYGPITEADFLAQYLGLRPYVRPELVFLLEHQNELIGYLFGIPDLLQAKRGQVIDTTIIKTIAVHPRFLGRGLGIFIMGRFQELSAELGYKRVIHALMQEDNRSRKISKHTAKTIRRYVLYARPLI
jgi:GNAT superfamily N-acetyltransferase